MDIGGILLDLLRLKVAWHQITKAQNTVSGVRTHDDHAQSYAVPDSREPGVVGFWSASVSADSHVLQAAPRQVSNFGLSCTSCWSAGGLVSWQEDWPLEPAIPLERSLTNTPEHSRAITGRARRIRERREHHNGDGISSCATARA